MGDLMSKTSTNLIAVASASPVKLRRIKHRRKVATAGVKATLAKGLVMAFINHLLTDPRNEEKLNKFVARQNDEFKEGLRDVTDLLIRIKKA